MDRGGPISQLLRLEGQQSIKGPPFPLTPAPPAPLQPGQKVLWSYTASLTAECGSQ